MFGVWSPGEDVAKLAYFGLYALQHRGQESAGIAVSDGTRIVVFKDMGLVAQVFSESVLSTLRGHIAVGHCRYSTSGSSVWENAQPTFRSTPSGSLALGHNGNLINTLELATMVEGAEEAWRGPVGTSDTDVLAALFADLRGDGVADRALAALPLVRGAFSLVFMDEHTLYAARDPQGFRPLVLGRLERGWAVAIGYAQASGIPYGQGLVKNSYVGRTFIEPSQTIRQRGIRLKLNPLRSVIAGQRVVVVDDSIVRGNTQQAIVTMLREAGAAEVHVRISSPPVSWPCFYGIDFATRAELIAGSLSVAGIRESIGADSLGFISQAGLTEATTLPADRLCAACFDGHYPIPVAEAERGKHLLENVATGRTPP